jgi:phosphoglucomutase
MSCYATGTAIKRLPFAAAIKADTTHQEDFVLPYVEDLKNVIDMDAIRSAWPEAGCRPARRCGRSLIGSQSTPSITWTSTVANPTIDPTFSFMTVDHDGQIRMDPSSPYAMARLVSLRTSMMWLSPTIQTPTGTALLHLPPG